MLLIYWLKKWRVSCVLMGSHVGSWAREEREDRVRKEEIKVQELQHLIVGAWKIKLKMVSQKRSEE